MFPRSWYPDTTPSTVQRVKVPACPACNDRWERIERPLADELLFVLSPAAPEIAGVHARLTRAWQVQTAKSAEDARHRIGRAHKVFRSMLWASPVPGAPQATLRTAGGLVIRASPVRQIENHLFRGIAEKFIRGLHYDETGEVLGPLDIHAFWARPERLEEMGIDSEALGALLQHGAVRMIGPGFWYRRVEAPPRSMWAFRIWGQVDIIAPVEIVGAPPT